MNYVKICELLYCFVRECSDYSELKFEYDKTGKEAQMTFRCVNTLRPRQNGRHFADDTFNRIFLNENVIVSIKFSLKFVPEGSINNNPTLFQIMAWHRPGDKPLSEPMMVSPLTHVCVTRLQRTTKLQCVSNGLRLSCTNPSIYFIAMRKSANHTGDHIVKMLLTNAKDIKFDN